MVAALFWKRSTKWGALAAALLVAAGIAVTQYFETHFALPHGAPPREVLIWAWHGTKILWLNLGGKLFVLGFMPVVPMVLGSMLCVILFSLLTQPPGAQTLQRYFPRRQMVPVQG
jgi:Na+/proline symporter